MIKNLLIAILLLLSMQLAYTDVITAKDLSKSLKGEDIQIISARNPSDYAQRHITGAINLHHKDLYRTEGVDAVLKPLNELAEILGAKGITESKKIVVYDDGENKSAGRIYWILKYLGAKEVQILDGHIKSWMKSRLPVTDKVTEAKPVKFTLNVQSDIYASMDYVIKNKTGADVLLVDVRSADEFAGIDSDEMIVRKGHIPGAVNFEYENVLNGDGTLKRQSELREIFLAAGISGDSEIILYCASSVRAGIVYLAMKSLMEFPRVRVYDGAYYEWESLASNPVQ